ncbi:hypothetical protein Y032_0636g938 [Ancylostoma ceylanicum]|uniref:Uncharacterized protein n=1 Tax=Ancylostoma ceylanicum TaxID=53326 RepID=A0A016WJC2_9BILA|nr:hypothetical protein Y032_0636g938 [Ancylostoma ceylanicum]
MQDTACNQAIPHTHTCERAWLLLVRVQPPIRHLGSRHVASQQIGCNPSSEGDPWSKEAQSKTDQKTRKKRKRNDIHRFFGDVDEEGAERLKNM